MTDNEVNELYQLMSAMTDGALDDRQQSQLQELLRGNQPAQLLYRDFMALHTQLFLEYTTGINRNDAIGPSRRPLDVVVATAALFPPDSRSRARQFAPWISVKASVLAVLALFALLGLWLVPGGGERNATTPAAAVGSFSRSANVQWSPGAHRWSVGDPLAAGESVAFESGRVELQFDSGALMTVLGPAALEIRSANLVALHSGTATTRIENGNSGKFRVVTPATEVLDLGTEFGVRTRPDGQTEVVVFEGKVDVTPVATAGGKTQPTQTLSVGEGVCVNSAGDRKRVVTVESDAFPFGDGIFRLSPRRRPLIVGVTDNMRSPERAKFYRIYRAGFGEDVRAYVDRTHEWNGLTEEGVPKFLVGADYVATFNDDSKREWQEVPSEVVVELSGPAMLYIFYHENLAIPDWLSESFENTGAVLGLDEGPSRFGGGVVGIGPGNSVDGVCSIWRRRVDAAQSVVLGPVGEAKVRPRRAMYGIAAQPL